jgi:hypothetical protein
VRLGGDFTGTFTTTGGLPAAHRSFRALTFLTFVDSRQRLELPWFQRDFSNLGSLKSVFCAARFFCAVNDLICVRIEGKTLADQLPE